MESIVLKKQSLSETCRQLSLNKHLHDIQLLFVLSPIEAFIVQMSPFIRKKI